MSLKKSSIQCTDILSGFSRKDKLFLSEVFTRRLRTGEDALTLLDEVDPDAEMSDAASDLVFQYASSNFEEQILPLILSLLNGL